MDYLKEKGKLPSKEEDKAGAEKELIREILREHDVKKLYRNRTSHNISYFPEVDEAFRELHYAILMSQKI